MSENIVRFGGDTTSRELWEGGPTGSTGFSRILNPQSRNFSMIAFQQAKPLLDSELNLSQQVQNALRAEVVRKLLSPGLLSATTITGVTDKMNTGASLRNDHHGRYGQDEHAPAFGCHGERQRLADQSLRRKPLGQSVGHHVRRSTV